MKIAQEIENLISLNSEAEIRQICHYLIKFNIIHFCYTKIFADGTHLSLTTHSDWMSHFYKENFLKHSVFHKTVDAYQSGVILWSFLEDQSSFIEFKQHSQVSNGIALIEKNPDSCEIYNFAADAKNYSIVNFYLNHLDILWRHTSYFKDRAHRLIQKAESDRLILPRCITANKNIITPDLHKEIESLAPIKRFYISGKDNKITYLTLQEAKCCQLLINGLSIKQIALIQGTSARTVETHILNAKNKLKCSSKSELIFILTKTILNKIIF